MRSALALAMALASCRHPLAGDEGRRVGALLHRVEHVTCTSSAWRVTVFRANVTQDATRASLRGITLVDGAGIGRPVADVHAVTCDGVPPCDVLDPGNSRIDVLSFDAPRGTSTLEVEAPREQAGPLRARFPLACPRAVESARPPR